MPRNVDVDGSSVPKKDPKTIQEIGKEVSIEAVSPNDFIEVAQMTAFMNMPLEIMVAPSADKGELVVITPNVNGVNMPIVRGVRTFVKRKYVEALARCTDTRYEQKVQDPSKPEQIQMVEITMPKYPFVVISDPHPDGYVWLKSITDSL